jgi:hypothetical protein
MCVRLEIGLRDDAPVTGSAPKFFRAAMRGLAESARTHRTLKLFGEYPKSCIERDICGN